MRTGEILRLFVVVLMDEGAAAKAAVPPSAIIIWHSSKPITPRCKYFFTFFPIFIWLLLC
jgi:hypothetical protein